MEFWNSLLTEKSWNALQELKKNLKHLNLNVKQYSKIKKELLQRL